MQMTPVYWLVLGVGLLVLEVMTPGLISLFFGMAGVTVALIVWLFPLPQTAQWLVFSFLSVVYILLLRKTMKNVFNGDKEVSEQFNDDFTGKMAIVADTIVPNKPGRVEFNGSTWTAEAESELLKGQSVRILGKKNLTLKVEAV